MNEEILFRLRRVYASVDATEQSTDGFKAAVEQVGRMNLVTADFSGELPDEQLANAVFLVIHNIANLRDNLRKWCLKNSSTEQVVWDAFNGSNANKIIQDLSNGEKHGYPLTRRNSGTSPKLIDIRRALRLRTGVEPGSGVFMQLLPDGRMVTNATGGATARFVITATVVDENGVPLGDLGMLASEALEVWEQVVDGLGISRLTT